MRLATLTQLELHPKFPRWREISEINRWRFRLRNALAADDPKAAHVALKALHTAIQRRKESN